MRNDLDIKFSDEKGFLSSGLSWGLSTLPNVVEEDTDGLPRSAIVEGEPSKINHVIV